MSRKSVVCLAITAMLVAGGCGHGDAGNSVAVPTGAKLAGDFGGSGPGTLVAANALSDLEIELRDASSLAARIVYTSGPTNVTGTVFVPHGQPPGDGWLVVALGHPTTGIGQSCAPSLSPTLSGLQDTIIGLLKAGVVVTVPDYQGLGSGPPLHPYLDSTTAGTNLIDAVRAARKLVRAASDRWVALGVEQGGQAAWAANELAHGLGAGLHLLGTISIAPFTDLEGLADAAATGSLSNEQELLLQNYLAALKNTHPDVDLDQFRRGIAQAKWDLLSSCDGKDMRERQAVAGQVTAGDLRPSTPAAAAMLHGFLRKVALPQEVSSAPLWVVYGTHDPLIPRAWTEKALKRACSLSDAVQFQAYGDKPPRDIDVSRVVDWFKARVKGDPVGSDCAKLSVPVTG